MERGSPEIEIQHSNFFRTALTLVLSVLLLLSLISSFFLYKRTQILDAKYDALSKELSSQTESYKNLNNELEQLRKTQESDSGRIDGAQKLITKNTEHIRDLSRVSKSIYHVKSYHNGPVAACSTCKDIFENGFTWEIK